MLALIVSLVVIGLVAGVIARAMNSAQHNMSWFMTVLLGVAGSFVGGFIGFFVFQRDPVDGFFQPAGVIGSVIGASILLSIYVFVARTESPPRRTTFR